MDEILNLLGKRIAYLRQKRGLTQEKLAEYTGYSPNHISKLESSRTKPSFDLLVMICKALQTDLKELFNFDEYKNKDTMINELEARLKKSDMQQIKLFYKIFNSINN